MIKVVHVIKVCIMRSLKIIMKQQNVNRSMTGYLTPEIHVSEYK